MINFVVSINLIGYMVVYDFGFQSVFISRFEFSIHNIFYIVAIDTRLCSPLLMDDVIDPQISQLLHQIPNFLKKRNCCFHSFIHQTLFQTPLN